MPSGAISVPARSYITHADLQAISAIYLGDISAQVKLQAMSVVNEKEVAESQRNLADVHAQLAALQARCCCGALLLLSRPRADRANAFINSIMNS